MERSKNLRLMAATLGLTFALSAPVSFASEDADEDYGFIATAEEIEAQIQEQRDLLNRLNAKKNSAREIESSRNRVKELEDRIRELEDEKRPDANSEIIDALTHQLGEIQTKLAKQTEIQELLDRTLKRLNELETNGGGSPWSAKLVNPMPKGDVSYTQDAVNAQNNSTMVFAYAPDQLYKIYCRTGFLTDIALREGENIKFVGGGDTSAWAINSSMVGKTPHLYIKPVVETNTTNIIITTDKRSYQLIVCTSDWYNPMVRWTYGAEDAAINFHKRQSDMENIAADANAVSAEALNFRYRVRVTGSADKPDMVFDDGQKTIIRLNKNNGRLPALFIRERGHKALSLTNFKLRNNTYVLDRVVDYAELRYGEGDYVVIERKK